MHSNKIHFVLPNMYNVDCLFPFYAVGGHHGYPFGSLGTQSNTEVTFAAKGGSHSELVILITEIQDKANYAIQTKISDRLGWTLKFYIAILINYSRIQLLAIA